MEAFSKFFGFNEDPFKRTPDIEFYYPTKMHEEALDTLKYTLESDEPFAVLTGEPGTGKTITIRKFISDLPENIVVAYILFPSLTPSELFMAILEDFKVKADPEMTKNALFSKFRDFLVNIKTEGKKAVIIIDEAQNLPSETLEELRILSNLETEKEKLLKIILAGQPELTSKLDKDNLRQLKQRITLYAYLSNIPESEIKNYINSHLVKAGRSSIRVQAKVVKSIAKITKGNPRLINTLMERTMVAAFLDNSYTITNEHLDSAMASVNTIMSTLRRKNSMKYIKIGSIAGIAAVFAFVAFASFSYISGKFYQLGASSQNNIVAYNQSSNNTQNNLANTNEESNNLENKQNTKNVNETLTTSNQVASSSVNNVDNTQTESINEAQTQNNYTENNHQIESSNDILQSQNSNNNQIAQNIDLPQTQKKEVNTTQDYFPVIIDDTPATQPQDQQNNIIHDTTLANNQINETYSNPTTPNTINTPAQNDNSLDNNAIPAGSRIVILANSLNVREFPDIAAHRVSSVLKGQQFYVLEDSPLWVKIRINGHLNGWVYKPHISIVNNFN